MPGDGNRYFAHEIMSLTLNGFLVHPKLELLMSRDDWPGKRTHENWLNRFPGHPQSSRRQIVEFCSPEWAIRENQGIQQHRFLGLFGLGRRDDISLNGKPDTENPPGDFDPWHGYLIGFTDYCDAGIFIDLRPHKHESYTTHSTQLPRRTPQHLKHSTTS